MTRPFNPRFKTAAGIPYALMQGYPKFEIDPEKVTVVEKYVMRSAHFTAFWFESFPPILEIAGYLVPIPRRACPGIPWLITRTVKAEPFNADRPIDPLGLDPQSFAEDTTYENLVQVEINYEISAESRETEKDKWDEVKPETFLEASVNIGGEFLSFPSEKLKIAEDGGIEPTINLGASEKAHKSLGIPILKTIPHVQMNLKWKKITRPPWDTIIDYLGNLNDQPEVFLLNFRADTVMFMGVTGQQTFQYSAVQVLQSQFEDPGEPQLILPWSLDYKFVARQIKDKDSSGTNRYYGWNHVYDPKLNQWVRAWRDIGSGNKAKLYESASMINLFKLAPPP